MGELLRTFAPDRISVPLANTVTIDEAIRGRQVPDPAIDPEIGPDTIIISDVAFTGNNLVSDKVLRERLKPFLGLPLSSADMAAAALAAAEAYHEAGYFMAQVVVPPQEIFDGRLIMLVLEGVLDSPGVNIKDSSQGTADIDYVRRILEYQIKEGEVIRRHDYERALMIAENLSGIHVRSRLFPGAEVGTGRLAAEVYQTATVQGAVSADNFGYYGTGQYRTTVQSSVENAAGKHEALSLVASASDKNQKYVSAEASLPVGVDGLKVGLKGAYMDYRLHAEYDNANETGDGYIFDLQASYPLRLLRDQTLFVTGKLGRSVMSDREDGLADFERTVDVAEISFHGDWLQKSAVTSAALTAFVGNVDITNGVDSYNTNGTFAVVELHAHRLQRLVGNFSASLAGKAQTASTNLDGLFKCSVGGPGSNRGYAVGEVSADQCLTFSSDVRYDFPKSFLGVQWQASTFFDYSKSRQDRDDIAGFTNFRDDLASVGVGVLASFGTSGYVNASLGYQLTESEEKKAVGHSADYVTSPVRFWVQGVLRF